MPDLIRHPEVGAWLPDFVWAKA